MQFQQIIGLMLRIEGRGGFRKDVVPEILAKLIRSTNELLNCIDFKIRLHPFIQYIKTQIKLASTNKPFIIFTQSRLSMSRVTPSFVLP